MYYAVPEGESSVLYIRFSADLSLIEEFAKDSHFMALVEKAVSTWKNHMYVHVHIR